MSITSFKAGGSASQTRPIYGAPFVKILYLTDLAQKLLSLRIFTYVIQCAFSYLCAEIAISARI